MSVNPIFEAERHCTDFGTVLVVQGSKFKVQQHFKHGTLNLEPQTLNFKLSTRTCPNPSKAKSSSLTIMKTC